jgi:uncharacterized hydrophobic protein (TIGR00341 family)
MPLKLIQVFCRTGYVDTIEAIAHHFAALHFSKEAAATEERAACRIVARPENQQQLIDQLQGALSSDEDWRIVVVPVEATIPALEEAEQRKHSVEQATREELYAEINRETRLDSTFLQLVVLSTIVAAIGLIESNVALIIAGMLIAPLLGPNVAMAFGGVLGDRELVLRAMIANAAGVMLSITCAAIVGFLFPVSNGIELMAQTRLGYEKVVLALASGAAGALSYMTKLASTLVGVMVSVALLPPAAALGYMVSAGQFRRAAGAAVLLVVNIVCVNLSAQLVFLSRGITPRRWIERRAAKQSVAISLAIACALLAALIAVIAWRGR